jgi:hypothetical protein
MKSKLEVEALCFAISAKSFKNNSDLYRRLFGSKILHAKHYATSIFYTQTHCLNHGGSDSFFLLIEHQDCLGIEKECYKFSLALLCKYPPW